MERIESYNGRTGVVKNQVCELHELGGQKYLVSPAFKMDRLEGAIYMVMSETNATVVRNEDSKSRLHKLLTESAKQSVNKV